MFQTTKQLYYSITLHHSVCLEIGPSGHGHFTLNSISIFDKSHETSSWHGSTVFTPWKSLNIIDNMDVTGNLGLIHRIDLSRIYLSIHLGFSRKFSRLSQPSQPPASVAFLASTGNVKVGLAASNEAEAACLATFFEKRVAAELEEWRNWFALKGTKMVNIGEHWWILGTNGK